MTFVVFSAKIADIGQFIAAAQERKTEVVALDGKLGGQGTFQQRNEMRVAAGNIIAAGAGHGKFLHDKDAHFVAKLIKCLAFDIAAAPDTEKVDIRIFRGTELGMQLLTGDRSGHTVKGNDICTF